MTTDHTVLMLGEPKQDLLPIFICLVLTDSSIILGINEASMILVLEERECE